MNLTEGPVLFTKGPLQRIMHTAPPTVGQCNFPHAFFAQAARAEPHIDLSPLRGSTLAGPLLFRKTEKFQSRDILEWSQLPPTSAKCTDPRDRKSSQFNYLISKQSQCCHNGRNFVFCPKLDLECRRKFQKHRASKLCPKTCKNA